MEPQGPPSARAKIETNLSSVLSQSLHWHAGEKSLHEYEGLQRVQEKYILCLKINLHVFPETWVIDIQGDIAKVIITVSL